MACNCKVNQKLTYLQQHFGTEQPEQKKTKPTIGIIGKKAVIWLILIPLIPIMLLYIIFRTFFKKGTINVDKFIAYERK